MNSGIDRLCKQAEGIVIPYSEAYEEAHTEFAQKMWPQKRRRRVPQYVRWKFRGAGQGPVNGFLLAVMDDRVVGQLGVIPAVLQVDDSTYPAQWACDLIVDTGLRRKGLGSLLLAVAMSRPMVSLGSDPSPSADAAMGRLGFRPIPGPHQMILPIQPKLAIKERLPRRFHFLSPFLAMIAKPIVRLRMVPLWNESESSSAKSGSWKAVTHLIQNRKIHFPHILHDASFLEWRCQGLTEFSPELESVYLETGAFAVIQGTTSQFFVYEWQAGSFREARSLFQQISMRAMEHDSQTIVVYANSAEERSWLGQLGFFTRRTPTKVIFYPSDPLGSHDYFHYCLYDSDGNL